MSNKILLAACVALTHAAFAEYIVTFDELSTSGSNTAYTPAADGNHDWTDTGVSFSLDVSYGGYAWDGMTYSSVNDPATPGYLNQHAVFGDGMGMGDTGSYAVFYQPYVNRPMITLPTATTVHGFYVNNTAYTALAMLNSEGPARAFSAAGNDWFNLEIEGLDSLGGSLGKVDFKLADYTGETGTVVSDWTYVNLTSLGDSVSRLAFTLTSTDNGAYGMNTPAYFAMDNLSVEAIPEPATITLALLSAAGVFGLRRFRA